MALSAVSSASIAVYAALETSSMQTCKYSQPGPRAAFVAAGLALLACLLAVGIQPSAAGPDALPQKTDVAALTCRDLDADGRPPLPLLWLDGYVSAQIDSDDVYLEWNNGRWQMQALPMLHAQCLRTPDMALTEAWKTAMLHFRSPDEPGNIRDALNLGYATWNDARSLTRKQAARPEAIAAVQESLFAALLLWGDGHRAFKHGGGRPPDVAELRPMARELAALSARLPILALGEALYLVREWPVELAALTCRDTGGAAGRGRFFFMTGRWLSGWAAAWREREPNPAAEREKTDADATEPEAGSAFIDAYCARHPAVPVTRAWRDADDEIWRAAEVGKRSCADIFRYGHDAVGWLLWWDGYQSHPSTRLPAPETFVARSAAIRAFCAAHPRMPFPDAARKALAASPQNITPPGALPAPETAAHPNIAENPAFHADAPQQYTGMAALTCREWAEAETAVKSVLPPEIWLDGYVSAQMNLDYAPVGLWRTKYFVAELPLILASQCRRTPGMAVTEAWKTAKMHERQEAKAYLGAPCSDLLRLNKKHGIDFRALACWWDGWHGWLERGTYQEEPQEAVTDRGRALEAACKANPRKPLMQILTGLRDHAARPDAE